MAWNDSIRGDPNKLPGPKVVFFTVGLAFKEFAIGNVNRNGAHDRSRILCSLRSRSSGANMP